MTDRLKLWDQNKDVAMLALAHLLEECDGLEEEPIIVITESKDPTSRKIAETFSLAIEAKEDIEAIVVANQNGATIQILPVPLARTITKMFNPECAEALREEAPSDQMWAAVISGGGMSLLQVPVAPLRAIGSA